MEALNPNWEGILSILFLQLTIGMMLLSDKGEARVPLMSHVTSRNGCKGVTSPLSTTLPLLAFTQFLLCYIFDLSCLTSTG